MSRGLIPEETIAQIRERVDIAQIVSEHVTLTRAGQNLKGLCPFHSEKTPSFTVSPSKQIFHCFGCGASGNAISFLMKITGADFPETIRELGRRTGVAIKETAGSPTDPSAAQRQRLERLNDAAAAWFRKNLTDEATGREARAYLADRGIATGTAEAFRLGYAPAGWDGLLRAMVREGFTPVELDAAGLVVAKEQGGRKPQDASGYYDRFRSRVTFPIGDLRRRTIGFGGRVLGDGLPKYLNSPDTPLFHKGKSLYALERARDEAGRSGTIVIVEGYFDVIALHQAGVTNVTATLGTALTPDHVQTLRRFVKRLVLLFDPDAAGVRAALRCLDLFVGSGLAVSVVSLPGGHDPDTFIRERGAEGFRELEGSAPSLLDFSVEQSLKQAASGTVEDRVRSVDDILRILQKTSHRIEKEECLRRVADRLGIAQASLIDRYPELREKPAKPLRKPAPAAAARPDPFKACPEERDLALLLVQGKLTPADMQALNMQAFTLPACRRLVEIGLKHRGPDGRVLTRAVLDEALADETCAPVATELAMSERHFDNEREHIHGCLDRLAQRHRQQALAQVIAELRAAEREGRTEDVRRLNEQVIHLRLTKATVREEQTV